jgi:hypothetical protein
MRIGHDLMVASQTDQEAVLQSQKPAPQVLLAELEEVIRTMPDRPTIRHETAENEDWFGRAAAIMALCGQGMKWDLSYNMMLGGHAQTAVQHLRQLKTLLRQMRHQLRIEVGPVNSAFDEGRTFDYFDELRKQIELASESIMFVDPYLDAEFVSRYLPQVKTGVPVRLLTTSNKLSSLRPALDLVIQQQNLAAEVRLSGGLHDRYVFIDGQTCFQSGASFKDGAKKSMTTITQITDVFSEVKAAYERKWADGEPA